MAKLQTAIRGTQDVLPKDSYKWQYVEKTLLETAGLFGFSELRVPVFEHTELFLRSVGDTTDEGTTGAVRCLLEHGLHNDALPVKASYVLSCYRYEKPQAGRLREFHQFGIECFGAPLPSADAEVISVAHTAFERFGLKNIELQLN